MLDYVGSRWCHDFFLPNIWLGVTAENQEQADKRRPILLQIPAAVHFVSIEPMLGAIDCHLSSSLYGPKPDNCHVNVAHCGSCAVYPCVMRTPTRSIDWVILGAETGPGKRQMDLNWALSVRDQCQAAGLPFFFKKDSDGKHELDGRLWDERAK